MPEHRWSGWPGAWCLDCGCEDPREIALADGRCDADGKVEVDPKLMECTEPGSRRFDPYVLRESNAVIEKPRK